MSDLLLGACLAMAIWQFFNAVASLAILGKTQTATLRSSVGYGLFSLFWLVVGVVVIVL